MKTRRSRAKQNSGNRYYACAKAVIDLSRHQYAGINSIFSYTFKYIYS